MPADLHKRLFAEQWIRRHGRDAPANLRRWALVPGNSAEAREFLYEIAQIAEVILAGKAGDPPESGA